MKDKDFDKLHHTLDLLENWVRAILVEHSTPDVEDVMNKIRARDEFVEYLIKILNE